METIETKITSQGQIPVPARIQRKLGLAPGSKIEWCERGDEVVIRRVSAYTSKDIHEAVFAKKPRQRTVQEMDKCIRRHFRRQHARR